MLNELGIDTADGRLIEVWNKADLLDEGERTRLGNLAGQGRVRNDRDSDAPVLVSAVTGEGLPALASRIEARIARSRTSFAVTLPPRMARPFTGCTRTPRSSTAARRPMGRSTLPCASRRKRSRASSTASAAPAASAVPDDTTSMAGPKIAQDAALRVMQEGGQPRLTALRIVILLVLLMAAQAYDGSLHA